MGSAPAGGWGILTVTARISPTLAGAGALNNGESSRLTLTAALQGNSGKHATSVLTTTASTTPITYGVTLAPRSAAASGNPGETVTYTLRVTNTGSVIDSIGLSYSSPPSWTVAFSANPLTLGSGNGQDGDVTVGIPLGAGYGATQTLTVTATSQGSPMHYDQAALMTTVKLRRLYLPLIRRNYP